MTARDDGFAAALQDMHAKGATGLWADGSDKSLIVGVPGMSGVARALAKNLDVRQLSLVSAVRPSATGWAVHLGVEKHSFDYVVITVPAPQIAGLLGPNHTIVSQIADVRFAPCLTLMAAVNNLSPLVTLNETATRWHGLRKMAANPAGHRVP